ncbi:Fe-S cluster assembly sulfur transfer protein SufU [Pelagicoccus sp. SDUM812003]|uniref:Fe-S cluster assembly sulfur transfer protein SufU n=1 Tax=Pelagicoccus sp. SDUM812003 TaxID=3041267 RepID=UPI00280D6800|nr:SUF system NifU family Fe-S cluster assembly protein [Pelagicoccus sp. SDUM812003]MDQ8201630.1 SUF system NifU family Fe-S cluster assembly protein [Pelagicoccus sp. SDUM812003]
MNPQLQQLYKETLLAHSKSPHGNHELEDARNATLRNPLCGDEITVYLKTGDNEHLHVSFTAQACSICVASASMMAKELNDQTAAQAGELAKRFVSNFKDDIESLKLEGDLAALSGVHAFPSRIRCATLPWEAAKSLLE